MNRPCFTAGLTPRDVLEARISSCCPDGFPMTLRCPWEWKALAAVWNQGIDSHLEAITSLSTADANTGEVHVHPAELPVLMRRLWELEEDDSSDDGARERCETIGSAACSLRLGILTTLGIEEV